MHGLLDGAQILPKSSTLWAGRTNVTDDRQQTDTDDRRTARAMLSLPSPLNQWAKRPCAVNFYIMHSIGRTLGVGYMMLQQLRRKFLVWSCLSPIKISSVKKHLELAFCYILWFTHNVSLMTSKGPFIATQLNSIQLDVELSWVELSCVAINGPLVFSGSDTPYRLPLHIAAIADNV